MVGNRAISKLCKFGYLTPDGIEEAEALEGNAMLYRYVAYLHSRWQDMNIGYSTNRKVGMLYGLEKTNEELFRQFDKLKSISYIYYPIRHKEKGLEGEVVTVNGI